MNQIKDTILYSDRLLNRVELKVESIVRKLNKPNNLVLNLFTLFL